MTTQVERLTENLLPDLLDSTAHVLVDARSEFMCQREEGAGGGGEGTGGGGEAAMTISLGAPQELSMDLAPPPPKSCPCPENPCTC